MGCHYKHLNIDERENLLLLLGEGKTIREIAREMGRDKSTISREIARNSLGAKKSEKKKKVYRPSLAQSRYEKRRKSCCPKKKLLSPEIYETVRKLFLEMKWSPEQIAGRMREEGTFLISTNTIYRAIYTGMFNEAGHSRNRKGAKRYLRHKGKPRKGKKSKDGRGKMKISHELAERPKEANERMRIGDWEEDTVIGKPGGPCLVTSVDRKSRFLVGGKSENKRAESVTPVMIKAHQGLPVYTITPDRGTEFSHHRKVTAALKAEFYFPPPHHPWERGSNENTNGLIREYFPKSTNFAMISEEEIQAVFQKLNLRPRKCLGFKTPFEVFYNLSLLLHLT